MSLSKCFIGNDTELFAAALSLPDDNLSALSVLQRPMDTSLENILSRIFITKEDVAAWDYYFRLFSPKVFQNIVRFLKPTELCFRWQGQVASIGGENIYLNVQMLMQKNFGHPSQRTWNLFAVLMMDDFNTELSAMMKEIAEDHFHIGNSFAKNWKLWMKTKSKASEFFESWSSDWYLLLKGNDGLKLWQHLPTLYSVKVNASPSEEEVHRWLFRFIQPHYYLKREILNKEIISYLSSHQATITQDEKMDFVEESGRILHVMASDANPIRKDQFWSFPKFQLEVAQDKDVVAWSWTLEENQSIDTDDRMLVLFDLEDFIIDGHYFSATTLFSHSSLEVWFWQHKPVLFDHQLSSKILSRFNHKLENDHFWKSIYNKKTKIEGDQTRLQCVQLASVGDQLHWDSLPLKNKPSNLKQVQFFHANCTYWSHYLKSLTKLLWKEFYQSKF